MKSYHNTAVLQFNSATTGNAGSGAPVTVRLNSTQALAVIYNLDEVAISNPLTTDSKGNYAFKVVDGVYDVIIKEGTANEVVIAKNNIVDYLTAAKRVIPFPTLASAVGETDIQLMFDGAIIYLKERLLGKKGSALLKVVLSSSVTANGLDIIESTGIPSLSLEIIDKTDPVAMGITPDRSDVTLAVANYLAINKGVTWPEGPVYITSLPDLQTINGGRNLTFKGAGVEKSIVEILTGLAADIVFNNFLTGVEFKDFQIKQVDGPGGNVTKIGKCFDSSASGAAFVHWDGIRTFGFDTVGEVRQSVWCTIGTMECKEYGTGPLSFVRTLKDGSQPTSGWNIFPTGWYNNSLTVENYLTRNGVNGPIFEGSSISIDTLTTEGLTGNGLIVRGDSSSDKSKLVTIQNLYQESITGTMIIVDNVNSLNIETYFSQGKTAGSPSVAILNANESTVDIKKTIGQDFVINGAILTNNSTLLGDTSGSTTSDKYVIDSTSRQISSGESPHVKKWRSTSLADGASFTCVDAFTGTSENLSLKIGVFYNGSPQEVQSWSLWVPSGGTEKIQQSTNGSNRIVGVAKSGNNLVITNNQGAQAMIFNITLVNETDMAIDGK